MPKLHYAEGTPANAACGVHPRLPPRLTGDPLAVTCGRCANGRRFAVDHAAALTAQEAASAAQT